MCSIQDIFSGRIRATIGNIVINAVIKQYRILRNDTYCGARLDCLTPRISDRQSGYAGIDIIKRNSNRDSVDFPARSIPTATYARRNIEGNILQDLPLCFMGKTYLLKMDDR